VDFESYTINQFVNMSRDIKRLCRENDDPKNTALTILCSEIKSKIDNTVNEIQSTYRNAAAGGLI
jgi:hypothetical protein